jgi:4-hydroxyphenylacetate 3-monooxygenase oxygenase component
MTVTLGALDGRRYRSSLDDGRDVWLDGERVSNVAEHPAFAGPVSELARLFDLQHDPGYRDTLTVTSPETGNRISRAYQLPKSPADLAALRRTYEVWMRESWGQHGRSPAFMAGVVVGLYDFRGHLDASRRGLGENAAAYYRYCSENDLVVTHALGDPQIDRSASPVDHPDYALRIIEENPDGVVVRGAKQLTTLAPLAHEILVYLSASFAQREAEQFVIWFALPVSTAGLKILCREPFGAVPYGHAHPLAGRFDEQDAMLFFDDVLVPWDRVFLLRDGRLAQRGLGRINAWSAYAGHIRYQERLRTLLGVSTLVAESIGVDGFRNVQENLGELVGYVEMLGHFIDAAEGTAKQTDGGLLAPGDTAAARVWSAEIAGRAIEIVRRIAASGILMQPSEKDLASELRPYLERYMRGRILPVEEKSRLFRLAWDLAGDSFAQRQDLYEYVHRGDLSRNRINLLKRHDQTSTLKRIKDLIAAPL